MTSCGTGNVAENDASLPTGPRLPAALQMVRWYLRLPEFLESCANRYGDTFTLRMPVFGTFVVFSAPDDVRTIFQAPVETFDDGGPYAFFSQALGPRSMLALTGRAHQHERRLLGAPLKANRYERIAMMGEVTRRHVDQACGDAPTPLLDLMSGITFEIMGRIVLGIEPGRNLAALRHALRRGHHPMLDALMRRFISNLPAPRGQRSAEAIIDKQIAVRRAGGAEGNDILSLLLRSEDADGYPMPVEAIRAEILLLMLAGHATSAATLTWTFEFIFQDSQVRSRIEEEAAAANYDPSREDRFEYIDATIKEVMRLRPIVPLVFRRLAVPMAIGDRRYPAGVTVSPCLQLAHYRPASWPEPYRFDPGRFVGRSVDPATWFPFGGGARRCLGANFALLEMRVVLVSVLALRNVERIVGTSPGMGHGTSRFSRAPSPDLGIVLEPDPRKR